MPLVENDHSTLQKHKASLNEIAIYALEFNKWVDSVAFS
jgi:hypothetical protein